MKNEKKKDFDAVKMMREIRDKLVEEYSSNPQKEENDLNQIRKKYNIQQQRRKSA